MDTKAGIDTEKEEEMGKERDTRAETNIKVEAEREKLTITVLTQVDDVQTIVWSGRSTRTDRGYRQVPMMCLRSQMVVSPQEREVWTLVHVFE